MHSDRRLYSIFSHSLGWSHAVVVNVSPPIFIIGEGVYLIGPVYAGVSTLSSSSSSSLLYAASSDESSCPCSAVRCHTRGGA